MFFESNSQYIGNYLVELEKNYLTPDSQLPLGNGLYQQQLLKCELKKRLVTLLPYGKVFVYIVYILLGATYHISSSAQTVLTRSPSGILVQQPTSSYSGTPANIIDGNYNNGWVSNYSMNNVFQFAFDPNLSGNTGLAGDVSDLIRLNSLNVYVPTGSSWAMRTFKVETQSYGSSLWLPLFSGTGTYPSYNFSTISNGGSLVSAPTSSYTGTPSNIIDGSINTSWVSNFSMNNVFQIAFDPNLSGKTGLAGDTGDEFTLNSVAVNNGNSSWSLKDFRIDVLRNGNPTWVPLYASAGTFPSYNFASIANGGSLISSPTSSYTGTPSYVIDGTTNTAWVSNFSMNNVFQFAFDPNLSGKSGLAGDTADEFTLNSVAVNNGNSSWSLKDFRIDVLRKGNSTWVPLYANSGTFPKYNFAAIANGGSLVSAPTSSYTGTPANIVDDSINTAWVSNFSMFNIFEFAFDPTFSGSSGYSIGTVNEIALNNGGNSWSLKDFQIWVNVGGSWSLAGSFTAAQTAATQTFAISPPVSNVSNVLLITSSNYGGSVLQINEFEVHGSYTGGSPIFTAAQLNATQSFDLTVANTTNLSGIDSMRLTTLSNYGGSVLQINEFEAHGSYTGNSPVFTAAQSSATQSFDLTAANSTNLSGIDSMRLTTLSNYGGSVLQINEFEALGSYTGNNPLFTVDNTLSTNSYDLTLTAANSDRRSNLTGLRLTTFDNYGGSVLQINEFEGVGQVTNTLGPDHYELSVPTGSITCLPTTATITACADSSSPCSNPYTQASGKTAFLSSSAGNMGANTVTFGSNGVATTTLSYPTALNNTAVSISLSGEQATASNLRKCCPNGINCASANSCSTTFNTAGFLLSNSVGGSAVPIATQTAGTPSSIYYLRAVQTNTATMACQAALVGTQSINIGYQCNNPATCYAANLMSINGGTATTVARNNNGKLSSSTGVNLTFDSNGNAPVTLLYSDVGQVTLFATATVNATPLLGVSNAFIVKPGGFVLSGIKQSASPNVVNPATTNAAGAKFVKAGEAFSVTVTATTTSGTTTPSFGNETSPESVSLNPSLVTGLGLNNNPTIAGTFGSFSNGIATGTAFSWNEVGIITLTPSLLSANYMGVAGNVTGTTMGNVGRFYPAQFAVSGGLITNRTDIADCATAGCGAFTYMGEQITAGLTLTAKATDGATTTQNYTTASGFAKLPLSNTGNPLGLGAIDSIGPTPLTIDYTTYGTATGSFTLGSATVSAPFAIARSASAVGPYNSVNIGIAPVDTDNVAMGSLNLDTNNDGTNDHALIGATALRYGRMKIANAMGSQLLLMPISVAAQYWNGSNYVTSLGDNNTILLASNLILSSYTFHASDSWTTTPALSNTTANNGIFAATLSKPNGIITGRGSVILTTNGPTYLPSNSALATFGVYPGNSHVMYMQENY